MNPQETPTLETQVHGQPFLITGTEESLIEVAERLRAEQRRQYALEVGKAVIGYPLHVTAGIAGAIGRGLVHGMQEVHEDLTLRAHDRTYGTTLYDRKVQKRIDERTRRLAHKAGLIQ